MRILRVIHSTNPESGGPLESLMRRSESLVRDGHTVEVVSLDSPADAATRSFPFPLTALGQGIGKYGFNPRLTSWVRENAARFDVVILHGLWNFTSFGAWLGLRGVSTPYFIFTHGMMDPWFRKKYPLKHFFKQIYWWLAEGRVLRDAQKVLFTCEEERLRARHAFRGYSYREKVVRYGTSAPTGDPDQEKGEFRAQFPALQGKRFLLFVGRIHPKKGCDLLIQALRDCASSIPDDVEVAMAGPDQVGWQADLMELAKRCGVENRIHWLGMLTGSLKWGAYRCADALILPSHQENFGIVVAEAMACGTPVLISDKVNIWREVLGAGAGLVAPDTVDGTCKLMRHFYENDASQNAEMRRKARKGFEDCFDLSVSTGEIIRIFKLEDEIDETSLHRRWKILQVIHSTDPKSGGPIESLLQCSAALIRAGHEVEVVTLEDESELSQREFTFPVTALGKGIGRYGYNSRLSRWVKENANRFDVIILNGVWNYSSLGAWRGLRGSTVPYFIFTHGMLDPWFQEQYPFKALIKRLNWRLLEGRVLHDARRVLFTCEEEKVRARGAFPGNRYTERVVLFGTSEPPNEPDRQREAFYEAMPALRGRRFLLFIGRIHPKKGCDMLVEAFADCLEQLPGDVDLFIAGPDGMGLVPALQQMAVRMGVEKRIHWTGMLSGAAKWGAFRGADAMVLPSHQENFGIVVAEALACGTPVLISDKVNIWREVKDAHAGLVEDDSVPGTLKLLAGYYRLSEEERKEMGECGRRLFQEKFYIESATRDLLQVFAEAGHPLEPGSRATSEHETASAAKSAS